MAVDTARKPRMGPEIAIAQVPTEVVAFPVARSRHFNWLGVAMLAPAVLYIVAIIGVPLVLAFLYAFGNVRVGSVGYQFVGLENFRSILQSPAFRQALANSFLFTICSQILVIVGSTILALALKDKFRGRGFIRFLILLPWVAPI
jgi:multiple sugar transport system permease protein